MSVLASKETIAQMERDASDKYNTPISRSKMPMAITGAIVQNEFHHSRYVYSNALQTILIPTNAQGVDEPMPTWPPAETDVTIRVVASQAKVPSASGASVGIR